VWNLRNHASARIGGVPTRRRAEKRETEDSREDGPKHRHRHVHLSDARWEKRLLATGLGKSAAVLAVCGVGAAVFYFSGDACKSSARIEALYVAAGG
jgi:hypothetical protein